MSIISNSNDDNVSIQSSVSISNSKAECPECKKELLTRYIFNHIRKLHPDYFSTMSKVWKEDAIKELIDDCKPFPVEWESKNDFDEIEFKNIWGCLGCNNTYTLEYKARIHCNAKCKKEHLKGLKDFLKKEQKEQEQLKKNQSDKRYKCLNRTADQIFNDTRIIINHYVPNLTSQTLLDDFIDTMNLMNPNADAHIFDFDYDFNITLGTDKYKMEEQEKSIWKKIASIQSVLNEALNDMYYRSDIVSDDKYTRLNNFVKITNKCPKLSYE